MRSSGVAPSKGITPQLHEAAFAFTAPLGLGHPMARAHAKLLGPCFKTGQRGHRPTRNRDAARASKDTRYTRRLQYPSQPEPETRGSKAEALKLHPRPWSGQNGSLREVPTKCRRHGGRPEGRVLADHAPPGHPTRHPEPSAPTSRTPPFTTKQFHVLLNSLFKVLCNFPSRYLFAIGLGVIFSLTWSLPRALSCTPKQLDSGEKPAQQANGHTGLSPSAGHGPSQGAL